VGVEYAVIGDCADRDGHSAAGHSTSREPHIVSADSEHCGDCLDVAIAEPGGPSPRALLVVAPLDFDCQPLLLDTLVRSSRQSLTHLITFRVVYDEHCPRRMLRERRSVVLVV